jgi:hypothetical protein
MPKSTATTNLDEYSTVAERIELFYRERPNGRITTKLVSRADRQITVKAFIYRDREEKRPAATGYAAEREGDGEINMVACLENAETSAIGRALANLGYTASKKRASREEVQKANNARQALAFQPPVRAVAERPVFAPSLPITNKLIIADFLDVIAQAEKQGLGTKRANVLRECVGSYRPVSADRLIRVEARVRYWLRRKNWM